MQVVVKRVTYALCHVPGLTRLGSKPARELAHRPELMPRFMDSLRTFDQAVGYLPHQIYLGGAAPEVLWEAPEPWYRTSRGERFAPFGEIMPELEFLGLLRLADDFGLVSIEVGAAEKATAQLAAHPILGPWLGQRQVPGESAAAVGGRIAAGALPLHDREGNVMGAMSGDHTEDESLQPGVLLENLASKASGFLTLAHLLHQTGMAPGAVDYLIGCGEEAVGDRYQRGGGNLAKAIGEMAGCGEATGSDTKAFCCAPVHALVIAGALVSAGVHRNVVVLGGGSLAKLGMKLLGHLEKGLPILEDVLAGVAVLVTPDDGESPVLRLDSVGKFPVKAGSQQQDVLANLVFSPLERLGLRLEDVDRYATELHNPEITLPAGSGDVARVNYRTIAAVGVQRGQWERSRVGEFERLHGMRGFSPTQGHIASAVPYLGHAWLGLTAGEQRRAMLLAKGSLFLGRMTRLSDGLSVIVERNPGRK